MSSLQDILTKSSECYYNTGEYYQLTDDDFRTLRNLGIDVIKTEVTDAIFDLLNEEYCKIQKKVNSDIPVSVGAPIPDTDDRKVQLPIPMPSLNECKEGEVKPFLENLTDNPHIIVMNKYDGCSCLLQYQDGNLVAAYTRGDGMFGQLITSLVHQIDSIPKRITEVDNVYIRGELIFPRNEIQEILEEMQKVDGKERRNGRNAIAGQLNAKTPNPVFLKKVHFIAYDSIYKSIPYTCSRYFSKSTTLSYLRSLGEDKSFEVCEYYIDALGSEEYNFSDSGLKLKVDHVKRYCDYECDGLVIMPDILRASYFSPTSESNPNPYGICKYKLNNLCENEAVSVVEDVEWAISKGGLLKPRARIKPTTLMDTTVTYVTGNNYRYIVDNKIGLGAIVRIKRAGDVTPQIIEVITPATEPKLPEEYVLKDGDDVEAYAPETKDALEERAIKQFLFSCMYYKLKQAGEATVRTLYKYDICSLPELIKFAKLFSSNGLKDILGANGVTLHNDIMRKFFVEGTTKPDFCAALNAFGRNIGHRLLERVYNKYNTLMVDRDKLFQVEGFSYTNVEKYMNALVPNAVNVLGKFDELEIKEKQVRRSGSKIRVVFTGIRDKNLEKAIENSGGLVVQTVPRANLVVAKDPNGNSSKLTKARDRGITIISIEEARNMFGEANVH